MNWINDYLPVFKTVARLTTEETTISYEYFQDDIISQINLIRARSLEQYKKEDCDLALFALTVWIDEQMLRSDLAWKTQWKSKLLQTLYFQTSVGGSLFFEKMESIESNLPLKRFYLLCLSLGFCGKYLSEDNPERLQCITAARECLPEEWQQWPCVTPVTSVSLIQKTSRFASVYGRIHHWIVFPVISVSAYLILLIIGMLISY